ncbi:MAG: hypothetical protein WBV06_09920 [Acidimicrobiia bacterium]|jgi:hypothetical protein
MSHDSGFRRGSHDATHVPGAKLRGHTKASDQFEERMRRKREQSERLGRPLEKHQEEE